MRHPELGKAVKQLNDIITGQIFALYVNAMKVKEAVSNDQHGVIILQLEDGECMEYEPIDDLLNLVLVKELLREE